MNTTRRPAFGRKFSLLLFVTIVALTIPLFFRWWPIDGVFGNLLPIGVTEDTEWAAGYSDAAFREVRIGMKRDDVYALLGRPIQKWNWIKGEVHESWTRSPGDTTYRERQIVFKGDTVVKNIGEFYFD